MQYDDVDGRVWAASEQELHDLVVKLREEPSVQSLDVSRCEPRSAAQPERYALAIRWYRPEPSGDEVRAILASCGGGVLS